VRKKTGNPSWVVAPIAVLVLVLLAALGILFTPAPVWAAACQWTGAVDSDWASPGNWANCDGGTPQSGDTATVPPGRP